MLDAAVAAGAAVYAAVLSGEVDAPMKEFRLVSTAQFHMMEVACKAVGKSGMSLGGASSSPLLLDDGEEHKSDATPSGSVSDASPTPEDAYTCEQILEDDHISRLMTFPNVLITAHQAFFTREALTQIARTTLENLEAFEKSMEEMNEISYSESL